MKLLFILPLLLVPAFAQDDDLPVRRASDLTPQERERLREGTREIPKGAVGRCCTGPNDGLSKEQRRQKMKTGATEARIAARQPGATADADGLTDGWKAFIVVMALAIVFTGLSAMRDARNIDKA